MDFQTGFIYAWATFMAGLFFVLISMMSKFATDKQMKLMYIAAGIHAFALAFNFLYTGWLGWNHVPETTLEFVLDAVTGVVQISSMVWFFYLVDMVRRQYKKRRQNQA